MEKNCSGNTSDFIFFELRQLAERAAMKAKFSPKPDAQEEQKGTITYIFELN
jgi:hypothetical protein